MSLNINWYKSYETKRKNSKNANLCFWTKLQKNGNGNISFLCHNLWTNQNLLEFRPVKYVIMTVWTSVLWKMNIHISKKWPELVITRSFIKGHSFPISLYVWVCRQKVLHISAWKMLFYGLILLVITYLRNSKYRETSRKYLVLMGNQIQK